MEQANAILRKFLKQQRIRAGFSIETVAQHVSKQPMDQIQNWEERPIKEPLNRIAQMVDFYKTKPCEFYENLWEVERAFRKK